MDKFLAKSLHKINGLVFEIKKISNTFCTFVIYKSGKNKRYIQFQANYDVATYVIGLKPKSRIKVKFMVSAKLHNDRWYNNLIAYEVTEWKKNENKLAREAQQQKMFDESDYSTKITRNSEWEQKM